MLNKIKSYKSGLNKTLVFNSISTLLLQGISFITVPIFSRALGSAQYGMYAIFNSWASIFSTFLSLNIAESFTSGRYKFADDYFNYRCNIILFTTIVSIFTSLVALVCYPFINRFINYSIIIYIVLLLTSFSTVIINAVTIMLVIEKKALLKLIISLFLSISTVILSLFFIFNARFSQLYLGRVIGHFIPYVLLAIVFIVYFLFTKKYKVSLKYFKFGIIFGLPLIGHTLSGALLSQSDRIMMSKMSVSSSQIGIYSLYLSFTSIVGTILNSFNTSFSPFYVEYIYNKDKNAMISKSKNYIEVFTIICIGFLLLSREVSYIFASKEFYAGINLIPIFLSIKYFTFMYYFSSNYEFYYGKTNYIAFGTISATIINIFLNYILINLFGMFGAAFATLLSSLLEFLFHYIISYNLKKEGYYVTIKYFYIPFLVYLLFVILFYVLKNCVIIRWVLGAIIGLYELCKCVKRKYIF